MKCLVTGGMGYIGSRVTRDLMDLGHDVICLDPAGLTAEGTSVLGPERLARLRLVRIDITDTHEVFRLVSESAVDVIVHHAFAMADADYQPQTFRHESKIRRMAGEVNLGLALRVNNGGMLNVLEAARLFGVRRVVFTSAIAALGLRITEHHPQVIGDDAVFRPDSMYGATKVTNEVMAAIYHDAFGVDTIGFRIARTYGATNDAIPFTLWNRRVALEQPVALRDPDYINSYIYVEDCAAAHVHAALFESTTATRVFNLREGEYSNRDLYDTIQAIHPNARVTLTEGPGDGMPTPRLDASGVARELGWTAPHSLAYGLREVYNHHRVAAGMEPLTAVGVGS